MSDEAKGNFDRLGNSDVWFLTFFALKMGVGNTSVMNWPWWWIAAPLWITLLIGILSGKTKPDSP